VRRQYLPTRFSSWILVTLEATNMRYLSVLFFLWLLSPVVRAAESVPLAEVFLCNLQSGKTMADLDTTVLSWQREFGSQAAFDGYFAAIWTPLRANTPYDLAWIGVSDSLNEWGAVAEGPREASEAHFADVVSCESALHFVSTVYEGLVPEQGDDESIVEVYGCVLHDGKTLADLQPGNDAWLKATNVMKQADAKLAAINMYQFQPWLDNTPFDTFYVVINDDLRSFAATNTAYFGSEEGQAAEAAFGSAGKCEAGLWQGRVVHRPKEE
jgi:hypothetical protein